ncbi:MAG: hypothetical protein AAGG68_29840 [Bacteroidota bacterium]
MRTYIQNLEHLISINRLEQAIENLLRSLSDYQPTDAQARNNARELRNYIIGISQHLHSVNDQAKKGTSSDEEIQRERRTVSNKLLNTIYDLDIYPDFKKYINEQEEEKAWQSASRKNTISAYQEYFERFPNGKYRAETHRIITELQEIEQKRSAEMKQIAEQEKRRRNQRENRRQEPVRQAAYSSGFMAGNTGMNTHSTTNPNNSTANGETFNMTFVWIAYVAGLFIPFISLALGIYLRVAKNNGAIKYQESVRKHGLYLIIVGAVMTLINMALMSDGAYYY